MKITPKYSIAFLLLFVLVQVRVFAQKTNTEGQVVEIIWNGSQDSNFNNPMNWSGDTIPDISMGTYIAKNHANEFYPSILTIPSNAVHNLVLKDHEEIFINQLTIASGKTLEVQGGGTLRTTQCTVNGKLIATQNTVKKSDFTFNQYLHVNGIVDLPNISSIWSPGDIEINQGGTLNIDNCALTMIVRRPPWADALHLSNSGTLSISEKTRIVTGGDILLNNNSNTTISNAAQITFENSKHSIKSNGVHFPIITLKNSKNGDIPQITLEDNLVIGNSILFEKGIIIGKTGSETLTLTNHATINTTTIPSDNSHATVKVIKEGFTDTFTFPLGDGTKYHPIKISKSGDVSTTYEAQFKNNKLRDNSLTGSGQDIAANEYWVLNPTTQNPESVVVSLYKLNTEFETTDQSKLDVIEYDRQANQWQSDAHRPATSRGGVNAFVDTEREITEFGEFTLHNELIGTNLPVELISFKATQNNKEVDLTWATATEINSEKFIVERSYDARHWEVVKEVQGAGNSDVRVDYEVEDHINNTNEKVYYRLTQFDFDGQSETFDMVTVGQNESLDNMVSVFPDPVHRGGDITISTASDEALPVRILSIDGKEMDHFDLDHQMSYRVNTQEHMIFVEIANGSNKVIKKVIVE
ncbi:hypothetical protein KMW28_19335 [Flammeovirga yaeyamensis]|uniref:Uncharacterized protein n=1 Tax=Flammeovirga yaeyamensis TaxID=367791 RepID=A0AAX1N2U5_9BACT|nr:hypothetical protein [Flammeovirga yaeyamensis]MBB3700776.1 hypothetical protein [Flammeovirga yaeyamensis]NMF37868.1 hypothetical protein [Flammeovirga yaeyamensis]QWG01770.1 hypothetical protein KMW28_19335 [Flammeovirga yaeyamensis]